MQKTIIYKVLLGVGLTIFLMEGVVNSAILTDKDLDKITECKKFTNNNGEIKLCYEPNKLLRKKPLIQLKGDVTIYYNNKIDNYSVIWMKTPDGYKVGCLGNYNDKKFSSFNVGDTVTMEGGYHHIEHHKGEEKNRLVLSTDCRLTKVDSSNVKKNNKLVNKGTLSIWPDTGQDKCYDNKKEINCPAPGEPFYGQDAQYQGPKRSYTKLGVGGKILPDSATPADGWIMTQDNVTGLIWEIKTDDGGIHDKDNTYTWCDPDPNTNGGNTGECGNGPDTKDFINALNKASFGGFSDWRLPTIKELSTLVDRGRYEPAIDIRYFPKTNSSSFYSCWSYTTLVNNANYAWGVYFNDGEIGLNYKSSKSKNKGNYGRAVRGKPLQSSSFVDNHDGTITDTATGLMWQKCSMGQTYNASTNGCDGSATKYTWQQALAECEGLELADHNDWRMPNINELQSIVDYSRHKPTVDATYFPNTSSSEYWSSTTPTNSSYMNYAWRVNFNVGYISDYDKDNPDYVRAVRSGQ